MKSRSISLNYFFNLCHQVLLVAMPLITTPYLSRVFDPEGIGRFSFAHSVASYFVMAAIMGTAMYGQRRIASVRHIPEERTKTFFEIVRLRLFTTVLAATAYGGMVILGDFDWVLFGPFVLEILAVMLDISWFFQGVEDFGIITGSAAVWKLLTIAAIFCFVRDSGDLPVYALIYCGSQLLTYLSQWIFVFQYLKKGKTSDPLRTGSHLVPAVRLFAAQAAIQIYTVLDKTMIGVITKSEAQNGYYEQAQKLIRVLQAVITSVGTVVASRVAALNGEKKHSEIQELLLQSFRLVLAVSIPMAAGVCLIAERFVPIFYGPGFDAVVPLLKILALLLVATGCSNVLGIQYMVSTGREKDLTRSVVAGSVVNVVLNLFFISIWQATGAACASLIAEICVTLAQFVMLRKDLDLKPVAVMLLRYLLLCVPMIAAGSWLLLTVPEGIVGVAVIVVICVGVYFGELILFRDPVIAVLRSWKQR